MPMDGMMVGFAARELDRMLAGGRIDRITQPERDTVILTVRAGGENRNLLLCASANNARCHLTGARFSNPLEPPALCMLMRKQLLGGRVEKIRQVAGDRILYVDMDVVGEMGDPEKRRLVLEMMGRHSNLMLLNGDGRILESAHHVNAEMSRVRQIQPGLTYMPPPGQGKLDPGTLTPGELAERMEGAANQTPEKTLAGAVSGLSAASAGEIILRVLGPGGTWPAERGEMLAVCERITDLFRRMPEMADPRVLISPEEEAEDVFPFPFLSRDLSRQRAFPTVSLALEGYFGVRDRQDRLRQRSASMVRLLKTQVERCEKKLALQEEELAGAARMEEYRVMGDVLNANLFHLRKGQREAVLPNWYDPEGGTIAIPLDERLTPSQNAQKYFRKYQKARSARQAAQAQKEKTLTELDYLEGMLLDVDKCREESELEEIREELVRTGYMKRSTSRRQRRNLPESRPFRYLSPEGIEILVGKNAVQNDRLTQAARPEEMWLHAKDMPGSHVIIRCEGEIPPETLRQAALLAAWYSRGQRSSLVPVDYTRRKYVRKPSGAAPGKVIYTHHRTAYMTVTEEDIRKLRL